MKEQGSLRISVVITTYNRKYEVLRALKSVLGQTLQPFEIIIVDDCSTDKTQEYIQKHVQAEYKYIYNAKNKGPGRSKNIGTIAAQGDYIAFLDSDNVWYADKLQRFAEVLKENSDIDMVCSRYIKHIEFGAYEYPANVADEDCSLKEEILLHNIADASASVYKKTFLDKVDGFNELMTTNLDWELLLRTYTMCQPTIYKIQEVLSENWQMDDGLSAKNEIEVLERMAMLSDYWGNISDDHLKILFYRQYALDHSEFTTDYLKRNGYYEWVGYDKNWMRFEYDSFIELSNIYKSELSSKDEKINRKTIFYTFLLNWLEARQKGITIAEILQKRNISTVAIYGFGRHGRLAFNELANSQIIVSYIIDKNTNLKDKDGLKMYDFSSELPEVDAIIISPFLEYDAIVQALMKITKAELLSLQDLVFEASQIAKEK